jgi:hypothetical protein
MQRQQLLILYSKTPDLYSGVGAWTVYDSTRQRHHTTGDSDQPPYKSVFDAMCDGWRVIQFPPTTPAESGMELRTDYLKWEYVLEKIVEVTP